MEKNIFTFWEPEDKVFPYLNLCIETWKKFYPDYTIHNISYRNLFDYIPHTTYDFSVLKTFSLPLQADAIRAALLYEHGGIWMDYDTIIRSDNFFDIFDDSIECIMFGKKRVSPHIGIIYAHKHAELLKHWVEDAQKRLVDEELLKTKNWAYLGNGIIGAHIQKLDEKQFHCIQKENIFLTVESNFMQDNKYKLAPDENYRYFWFENNFFNYFEDKYACKGLCLHNSWTPAFVKQASENTFLNIDCTLSDLLCSILEKKNKKTIYYSYMKKDFIDTDTIDNNSIIDINIDNLNYKMYLPDKDDADQRLIITKKRPRECDVLAEMRKFVDNPAKCILIDIGHNCGNHSAYFAALGVEVHAFDPNRHLSKLLQKTIQLNSFENITLYNIGLSDRKYSTSFHKLVPTHSGSMSLLKESGALCDVTCLPLDSLNLSFPFKKTIIKIDVEGMEIDVLRGMKDTLREINPEALFIEIHTLTQLKDIIEILSQYGYILDRVMESHTCKFIRKCTDTLDLFISEQRFLSKELLDVVARLNSKIDKLKNDFSWNSLVMRPDFCVPEDIYYSVANTPYLQLYIRNVSPKIHYEFSLNKGAMQYCLHCEDASLIPIYQDIFTKVAQKMGTACIEGKTLQINLETQHHRCVEDMKKLISLSLEDIKKAQSK